jgi:hypothetical protein
MRIVTTKYSVAHRQMSINLSNAHSDLFHLCSIETKNLPGSSSTE